LAGGIGEDDSSIAGRYGPALAGGERKDSVTVPDSCRSLLAQRFGGCNVLAVSHVPEIEVTLRADGHESLAVRAKRERANAVGEVDPGNEVNIRRAQGGHGLGSQFEEVAPGRW